MIDINLEMSTPSPRDIDNIAVNLEHGNDLVVIPSTSQCAVSIYADEKVTLNVKSHAGHVV